MSKPFALEKDDRTEEERAKAKACKKAKGIRGPMDTDFLEDEGEIPCHIRFKVDFSKGIQGIKEDPSPKERFDRERLFDAVSSGDVSKLEGLHEYLRKQNKKLTDSTYRPNGKTALLKALLNLKNGKNEAVEHLLDIAEKMGHLEEFVNAPYTDCYYQGQTALHIAIERRSKHFAELLIEKGADVHARACGSFFQPHGGTCFYFGELPLSLAACTNQKDMVDLLMDNSFHKADIRLRDSQGNTVLHALVMVADNSPENTDFVISMYDYILTKDVHLNPDHKNLEDIRNNKGLTPLKLAAKTGKIGLFEHILNREFHQEECRHLSRKFTEWAYGPVYASLFDLGSIDTYEENSVLEIIVYGSAIPNRLEMLQTEPINKLLEDKWDRFAHRIFLFKFICYLIYLIVFTVLCCHHKAPDQKKGFRPQSREDWLFLAGQVFTCAAAVYLFLKGLMDMKRKPPRLQTILMDGYSDLIFLLQATCFLVYMGMYYSYQESYLSYLVVCLALSWINLLYFSRGSQHMGIYSVMIQRMILGDIFRFLFVYFVFLFGFSAAVMALLQDQETSVTNDSNVTNDRGVPKNSSSRGRTFFEQIPDQPEGCKKLTFKNMSFTTLELFKFTIGMGDLEFTEQYQDKAVFYILLISYIVLTYILLLNMLIALMSRTVEVLSKESTKIWKLQRAITILDLERSLGCCLKANLRSGVKKDLGKAEKDVRWCLRVEEVNWNKCNQNLGIISEDPGNFSRATPSPSTPQRGQSLNRYLRGLSRRRPNTRHPAEEQEMTPLEFSTV